MAVSSYIKNVGRSFGYVVTDVFKSYNPAISSMLSDSKDLSKEIYQSAKTIKQSASESFGTGKQNLMSRTSQTWNNFKEDIRSGNFYNRERMDEAIEATMDDMFGDEDFDFDFGDNEQYDFEADMENISKVTESSSKAIANSSKKQISQSVSNTNTLTKIIKNSGDTNSRKIIQANAASTDYLANVQREVASSICGTIINTNAQIVNQIAIMNVGVTAIAQLAQPLASHIQNAETFYVKSTEYQNKVLEMMQSIVENTSTTDTRLKSKSKGSILDLIGLDGGFDFNAWKDMIAGNVGDLKEEYSSLFGLVKQLIGGSHGGASPISTAMGMAIKAAMPTALKQTMTEFNDYLTNFTQTFLANMQDKSFGFLGDMVKDLLVPQSLYKDTLDVSNYNKGKVDWDGKSRQALMTVIPYQLSQLVSAVTGQDQKIYNYDTGRWIRVGGVAQSFADMRNQYANKAGNDYKALLSDAVNEMRRQGTMSQAQSELIKQQVQDYIRNSFSSKGGEYRHLGNDNFNYGQFGLDKETWEFMRNFNRAMQKNGSNVWTQFTGEMTAAREEYGKKIRELDANGESIYQYLFNNSLYDDSAEKKRIAEYNKAQARSASTPKTIQDMSVNLGTDKYGYDIWHYLQGLYMYTKHVSDNIEFIGGGGNGGGPSVGSVKFKPVQSISNKKIPSEKIQTIRQTTNSIGNISVNQGELERITADILDVTTQPNIIQMPDDVAKYKAAKDAAEATGQPFNYDSVMERRLDSIETANMEAQRGLDRINAGFVGESVKSFQSTLTNVIGMPVNMMSRYMKAAQVSMDRMLFGDDGSGSMGIMDTFKEDMESDFFRPLKDLLSQTFAPVKAIFSGFAKLLFGTKNEEGDYEGTPLSWLANGVRNGMRTAGGWVKDLFYYKNPGVDYGMVEAVDQAANGRRVTRSGIVAVSEGEMIIPAELNPFYHKKINKAEQYKNERNSIMRFFGSYADGGTVGGGLDDYIPFLRSNNEEEEPQGRGTTVVESAKAFVKAGMSKIGEGISSLLNTILPQDPEGEESKLKANIRKVSDSLFKTGNTKDNLAAGATGAIIGGGVSLLTGSLFGPLVGAALGGATGMILQSKELRETLFGSTGEDGEYHPGILPESVSSFITSHVPAMGKGATIGGIGGLFMGSPVLGAVLGATAGYITSSESAKASLFGEMGEDGTRQGGIISKALQTNVKKAFPNIAAGVLAGAALGPFGLVGNIVLGAAAGYASSTERFKNYLFGERDEDGNIIKGREGLIELIKTNIAQPMVGIFDKLAESIKHTVRDNVHNLAKSIRKIVIEDVGVTFTPIIRFAKGVVGTVEKVGRGLFSGVGNILTSTNNRMENKALMNGYSIRDRSLGRKLTASERMERREEKGLEKRSGVYNMVDEILSNIKTESEMDEFQETIARMYDPARQYEGQEYKSRSNAVSIIGSYKQDLKYNNKDAYKASKSALNKLDKAIRKGDYRDAEQILYSIPMDDELRNNILTQMMSSQEGRHMAKIAMADSKAGVKGLLKGSKYEQFSDQLASVEDSDVRNILDYIRDEKAGRSLISKEEEEEITGRKATEEAVVTTIPNIMLDIRDILTKNYDSRTAHYKDIVEATYNEKEKEPVNGDVKQEGEDIYIFSNGKWNKDMTDTATRKNEYKKIKVMDAILVLPAIVKATSNLGTLLGNIKTGLLGDGEEKPGLIQKMFNFFKGEDEPNFFTNVSNSLEDSKWFGVLKTIAKIALPIMVIKGAFDKLGEKISSLDIFKGNDTDASVADNTTNVSAETGKEYATTEDGNFIYNEEGQAQMVDGTYEDVNEVKSIGSNTSISAQVKKGIVNRLITAKLAKNVVKKATKNIRGNTYKAIGKGLGKYSAKKAAAGGVKNTVKSKVTGKLSEIATEAGDDILNPKKVTIMGTIAEILEKLPKWISKIPIIGKHFDVGKIDTFCTALCTKMDDIIKKATDSKLGTIFSSVKAAMPYIQAVYVAGIAVDAWGNAEAILGILDASVGQRLIAVLIAVINSLIPGIGGLIPNDVYVNVFMEIAPKIGIDVSELKNQRDEAREELDAYNEENGTSYNLEQYLQDVKGKGGIITKTKNKIKSGIATVKGKAGALGARIKSKGLKTVVNEGLDNIKEKASGLISKVSDTFNFGSLFDAVKAGDLKAFLAVKAGDEDDNKVVAFGKNMVLNTAKYTMLPIVTVIAGVKKIGEGIKKVINWGKEVGEYIESNKATGQEIWDNKEAHFSDYFKIPAPPEGPFKGMLSAFAIGSRLMAIPVGIAKKIARDVGNGITKTFDKIKTGISNIDTIHDNLVVAGQTGDIKALWGVESADEEGNPLGGIYKGVTVTQKVFMTPGTLMIGLGHKIGEFFRNTAEKVKNGFITIDKTHDELVEMGKTGDLKGLWSIDATDEEGNPLGKFYKGIAFVEKIFMTPGTLMYYTGHKIKDVWTKTTDAISNDWSTVKSLNDTIKEYADKGDVMGILNTKFEATDGNILGGIHSGIFTIMQSFQVLKAGIHNAFGWIGDAFGGLKDKATQKLQDLGLIDKEEVDENGQTVVKEGLTTKVGNGIKSGLNAVGNFFDKGYQSINEWAHSGAGSGTNEFVSQRDPRYANNRLGGSNVAQMGCAPAAATMALNMRNGRTSMAEATNVAQMYQTTGGTDAGYFNDFYRAKGVQAQYYRDPSSIARSVAGGGPTILMGRDPSNTTKRKSPFGPNNHYVVANGFDKNGKIIINDPEMKRARKYPADILRNVSLGVGMGSGLLTRLGLAGAGNRRIDSTTSLIWNTFRSMGYSEAATAGIMGNMDAESGCDPAAVQPNGDHAIGLCQWIPQYGRADNMKAYCSARGYDWTVDIVGQCEFVDKELSSPGNWAGVTSKLQKYTDYNSYKNATDVNAACNDFCMSFERPGKIKMDYRQESARYYYENFSGKKVEAPENTTLSGDVGDSNPSKSSGGIKDNLGTVAAVGTAALALSGGSNESSGGSILDKINGFFSSALGKIFGGAAAVGAVNGLLDAKDKYKESKSNEGNYEGEISNYLPSANFKGATPVDYMRSMLGKLKYSMSGPRDPEQGSADCSSTVRWAVNKATGKDIGGYTLAQYNDDDLETVWYNGGKNAERLPDNIEPNDILFFSRHSDFTQGRPDRVGHVGIYEGDGMMLDHGKDNGVFENPVIRSSSSGNGLIKVMRIKGLSNGPENKPAGMNMATYNREMRESAAGSGLMNNFSRHKEAIMNAYNKKYGITINSNRTTRINSRGAHNNPAFIGRSGGASNVVNFNKSKDDKSIALMLKSIIPLIEAVVTNTKSIDGIYNLVAQLVRSNGGNAEDMAKIIPIMSESMKSNKDIDDSLKGLKATVDKILEG